MSKKNKIWLSVAALLIASLSLVSEDFSKFVMTGHSATYNITLIKHNFTITLILGILTIIFVVYSNRSKVYKNIMWLCFVLLVLSLKTYAIVEGDENTYFVSGYSFIPIKTWHW